MRTVDALTLIVDKRISMGTLYIEPKTGQPNYDLNYELHMLFGDPKNVIAEFNKKFAGRTTPELIDLLTKAGIEALEVEAMSTRIEYCEVGNDFANLVLGEETLKLACFEKKRQLSEKMFCIESALGELRSFKRDLKDFLQEYA